MNQRVSQLWQRFRDSSKEFKRSHAEALFNIIREQQSQIEQLEAPVKEVMAQSEDFDGVNTIAYIRALHKKMDGQRKHIATIERECERLKQLLTTTLDGEEGIHVSTGGKKRNAVAGVAVVTADDEDDFYDDDGLCPDCGEGCEMCACNVGDECGRWRNGVLTKSCSKAGSEECDFECPYRGSLYG